MAKSRMPESLRSQIIERYDGACALCGSPGSEIDHIIPRSHFGSKRVAVQDSPDNLQLLCYSCHRKKHG